jgi:uncharacterized iron-regulated membrane protein
MRFRSVLFWLHLGAGVIAGLSIAVMCFTGVTLAFEKQLVDWSERPAQRGPAPAAGQARLPVDELLRRVRAAQPGARPSAIVLSSDPQKAVSVSLGRTRSVYVDPSSGAVHAPASTAVRDLLQTMENWHRVLALGGDQRPIGKAINGACNLAFFVLAVTGLYLWMPRSWSWRSVRAVAFFRRGVHGKARDFNWHNVIGLWCAPILIVLTLTAVPISYRWGSNLVYRLVGEEPPAQAGPAGFGSSTPTLVPPADGATPLSRDAQFAAVQKEFPASEQITLRLSTPGRPGAAERRPERSPAAQPVTFIVKLPGAWPRTATTTVTLNPYTGELLRRESFADQSAGRRLRTWTRFLHTGEALGWPGQLIAGLACLGGCFLVYTGLALAWRRFFGKSSSA